MSCRLNRHPDCFPLPEILPPITSGQNDRMRIWIPIFTGMTIVGGLEKVTYILFSISPP